MTDAQIAIFDGHNDTALELRGSRRNAARDFFAASDGGHVDLPRARRGGMIGGFFAVFVLDPGTEEDLDDSLALYDDASSNPPMMSTAYAQSEALATLGTLLRTEAASNGQVRIVRTADDLRACIADGTFAMEVHFEGAEPIDPALESLEAYYAAGLRSIGLVWSRANRFGHGVPFAFPSSPDTGPGLTDPGKALVRACNQLGIMLDIAHLNEKGFWDLASITDKPIVGTHNCAHAIAPSARNLTDKQLDAIKESNGLVGVNFHVGFLRPDGKDDAASVADTGVAVIADHVDYFSDRLGIDGVALGSDFDGAKMPGELKDAAGLPKLVAELRRRGYDDASLTKIGTGNWLRIFDATWKA